ncbi:MAG: enoyl-CoA hydratase/isomerase family protein [bacterium]|nr:enoyl-CoA hydratase [Deltaproteobacteria bacterium]MCP4908863.1 enoyl-CoA hydratase/isomerase family protein [bacterium]
MMAEIEVSRDGQIATVLLNRPERMNTISQSMLSTLSSALLDCDQDPEIRAIVIAGAGRAFCAGLDLQDAASDEGVSKGGFALAPKLELRDFPPNVLHHLDTPTICAINGGAAGFGLDLALCCDIRIAGQGAKLAAVFTKRGVVPESGGTWLLPRLIGWAKAAEIVFTGRTLGAEESLELGLVNQVVEDAVLLERARAIASEIADNAPLAVQAAKRMMRAGLSEGFDENVERVYLQVMPLLKSDDFREGFTAFLEKRKPKFEGR